jgi:predicted metal-binding transcription factor (methanogenesis marker protein 9)
MEKNYWQIDENLYKVHISSDIYNELKEDFNIVDTAKYMKEGEVFAYDIMVKEDTLQKVIRRLEEFDC